MILVTMITIDNEDIDKDIDNDNDGLKDCDGYFDCDNWQRSCCW